MNELDQINNTLLNTLKGALACAIVNLENGTLNSVAHQIDHFDSGYIKAVSAAAVDMFRGRSVQTIESLLANRRNSDEIEKSVEQIQMTTTKTLHFMQVVPEHPDFLIVLVTDRDINPGLGWVAVRRLSDQVAPLLKNLRCFHG